MESVDQVDRLPFSSGRSTSGGPTSIQEAILMGIRLNRHQ